MSKGFCKGKVKIIDTLYLNECKINGFPPDDTCHNYASQCCEDCGKWFCRKHIDRDKHKCDDSVKGCHSMIGGDKK